MCEQWGSTLEGKKEITDFRRREARDVYALCAFLPGLYSIFGIVRKSNTNLHNSWARSKSSDNLFRSAAEEPTTTAQENFGDGDYHQSTVGTTEVVKHSFQRLQSVIYKLIRAAVGCSGNEVSTSSLSSSSSASKPIKRAVVMLLDDIHWADQSSLNLIKFLVEEDLGGPVFVVATYRSEVVQKKGGINHPVTTHLNELKLSSKAAEKVHNMPLSGFSTNELNEIVSSFTHRSTDETMPFVQVIHKKTAGNPLFVQRFLYLLEQQGYLSYCFMTCTWEWKDVNEIRQAVSIESHEVVEVIASSMKSLDHDTLNVLKIASCLGSQVPLNVLQEYFASDQLTKRIKGIWADQS